MINISYKPGAIEKLMEANAKRRDTYDTLVRLSKMYDEPGKRILDIGIHGDIYPGGHKFLFKNALYETMDIDGDAQPTYTQDIRDMFFPDDTFDLIIIHSVIEHVLEDRTRAYEEVLRVLKVGGTALYVIPIYMEEREVEPAKHVSKTQFIECHRKPNAEVIESTTPDRTYVFEVRKI